MVSKKHEFLLESILATLNIANGLSKNTIKSNDVIDKELLTFKASNNTILAFKMFNWNKYLNLDKTCICPIWNTV